MSIKPPWYDTPIENTAFNAYAFHTSELEARIQEGIKTGYVDLEGLNEIDANYVIQEIEKILSSQ